MKLKVIFLAGILYAFSAVAEDIKSASAMTEDELIAAAERLIAQEQETGKVVKAESTEKTVIKEKVDESEIPAFRGSEKTTEASSSPLARLLFGAGIILTLAFGLLLAAKRFGKKSSLQNSNVRMDIVAQKAISPKQNLVVVRVAGEHILIGATDNSVNMIKSISLIDDEAQDNLPQDFNNFLEDEFVEQPLNEKQGRTFTL